MKEQVEKNNRIDVLSYYDRSEERGYWGFLNGICHYGFTPENQKKPFNMESAQYEMELKLGEKLGLAPNSRVLDAGCGYGPVTRTLTKEFELNVTGLDLIQMRLEKSLELNNEARLPSIDFVNGDYHNLPFADNTFDGVFTMETLVHAFSYEAVLKEFLRVLKPGGRIVLFEYSIPNLSSVAKPARKLAEKVIRNTGMTSLPYFTHGSFSRILSQVGFENIRTEDISRNVYPSWLYMWKFAIRFTLEELGRGKIGLNNIPGSMWIWPARHRLGYNICEANKPE